MSCTCDSFPSGSIGVILGFTPVDCRDQPISLVGLSAASLRLVPPSGSAQTKTPVSHPSLEGVLIYTTVDGDFAVHGKWKAQLTLTFDDGRELKSKVFQIQVDASL